MQIAPHDLRLSRYVVTSDPVRRRGDATESVVLFSTRTGALLVVDARIWSRLRDDGIACLDDALRTRLAEAGVLVSRATNELADVVHANKEAIADLETLYQVIQPTAWCQLGCGYCGQTHTRRQLSQDAHEALLKRLEARLAGGRYRSLLVGWFGAEPLAGLASIRQLSPQLRALANAYDCAYGARIVTNGYTLTAALARELAEQHGVAEAEITLDGVGAAHDQRRPTKAGRGSFDRIFRNLQSVAETGGLQITIRCNVGRDNADGVSDLIEALSAAGLAGKVQFYTSPVYAWGNDAHQTALAPSDYAEREINWLAQQIRLGFDVGLIPPRRKVVCLSVQPEAEVLDAYGATFNCTEAPYVDAYGSPNRYEFEVPAGEATARGGAAPLALRHFNERLLAGVHETCGKCPMLPVCGGHCPKAWEEGHAPCPASKLNIRQRLNLAFALMSANVAEEGALDAVR